MVNLSVRNFALVKELSISLEQGLTVITGESGAGKSILLQALALVLGNRAKREQIRPGADQCEVTAEFDIENCNIAQSFLSENDFVDSSEPNKCLVRRVARIDGRSRAWINGIQVNIETLRSLCGPLVALHGQFEQMQLVDPTTQLTWFDDFATDANLRERVESDYHSWQRARDQLNRTKNELGGELGDLELVQFQLQELDQLDLKCKEFEQIHQKFKRASQAVEIREGVHESQQLLDDRVRSDLSTIARTIARIDDQHNELSEAIKLLESAQIQIDESAAYLNSYLSTLEIDEHKLTNLEKRLDGIHEAARKHRVAPSQLFEHIERVRKRLAKLQSVQEELKQQNANIEKCYQQFLESSQLLSAQRKELAPEFCSQLSTALEQIALPNCRFTVEFSTSESKYGIDAVEYQLTTNTKYTPMPLGQIASGGELSRVALAILVVVAQRSRLPCLVLDEADVGIGGVTADMVGRMLRSLAGQNQIICVSHAPQVAALGGAHLYVSKSENQEIEIIELRGEHRIEEIARMVSGQSVNSESRRYAKALLQGASTSD